MEKPALRSKATKVTFKDLLNPTSFIIPKAPPGQNREAKAKAKPLLCPSTKKKHEPLKEATSPKVSCMGRIESEAGNRCRRPGSAEWRVNLPVTIRRIFRRGRKVGPGRAAGGGEGRRLAAGPPIGQTRRFASGREKLLDFHEYWRELDEEAAEVVVVVKEKKKEVNIWKRRLIAQPIRLNLN